MVSTACSPSPEPACWGELLSDFEDRYWGVPQASSRLVGGVARTPPEEVPGFTLPHPVFGSDTIAFGNSRQMTLHAWKQFRKIPSMDLRLEGRHASRYFEDHLPFYRNLAERFYARCGTDPCYCWLGQAFPISPLPGRPPTVRVARKKPVFHEEPRKGRWCRSRPTAVFYDYNLEPFEVDLCCLGLDERWVAADSWFFSCQTEAEIVPIGAGSREGPTERIFFQTMQLSGLNAIKALREGDMVREGVCHKVQPLHHRGTIEYYAPFSFRFGRILSSKCDPRSNLVRCAVEEIYLSISRQHGFASRIGFQWLPLHALLSLYPAFAQAMQAFADRAPACA